eukprot:m.77716 g.77716  ORF g.77716 m.77716 type:complete len:152 (+) comp9157_c0_seq1:406-861(+)
MGCSLVLRVSLSWLHGWGCVFVSFAHVSFGRTPLRQHVEVCVSMAPALVTARLTRVIALLCAVHFVHCPRSETGYKRRVHCVFTDGKDKVPQDTYESCSIASADRLRYFAFEATCAVFGGVFVVAVNKRKALLYDRIERKLRQQIDNVDVV